MATTAGDVLLSYLEQQLSELRRHAPGVREDEAESVHQMRVAARRLRSLLASSRKLFSTGEAEDIRSELRWLSGSLGAARDPRVVQARLRELLAAEPEELTHGRPARLIDAELGAAAAAGHQDVLAALDSERYARLITGLESLLTAGKLSGRASRPPRKAFRKAVSRDTARLVRAVADLPAASHGNTPVRDARLHEVRKAAKRLRYFAELAATVRGGRGRAGKRARKTAKAARRIQTTLGLHHDTVMSRTLLAELGLRSLPTGGSGFSFGRLHAREESLAAGAEADFVRMWRKFPGRP
ncbi:CHAD domain-containing protein [Arthrobacter sp. V4I6]|uniref:CHAD domain-containing protein n=1 Tax=unclassified Arthrobacter TaxID=235627 RepID=UPI00277FDBFB|nr:MULTISPECIES: CHAD domain-containing protein [unclassified Arthrobacter]MDQ0819671.1 CHAD domain-containing protein [Arthrobacter sp. V1I7]MDQ0853851.1 CHAD domain-containing protein [Arthrobacter sp. V4I6]